MVSDYFMGMWSTMKIYVVWGSSQHSLLREQIPVPIKWIYCTTGSTFCLYNSLPHTWSDTHLWDSCTHFQCLYVSLVTGQISNPLFFSYTTVPNSHHFVSASDTRDTMSLDTLAMLSRKSGRWTSISFPSSNPSSPVLFSFSEQANCSELSFFSVPIPWKVNKSSLNLLFIPSLCLGHLHWRQSVTTALLAMLTMEANSKSFLSFLSFLFKHPVSSLTLYHITCWIGMWIHPLSPALWYFRELTKSPSLCIFWDTCQSSSSYSFLQAPNT